MQNLRFRQKPILISQDSTHPDPPQHRASFEHLTSWILTGQDPAGRGRRLAKMLRNDPPGSLTWVGSGPQKEAGSVFQSPGFSGGELFNFRGCKQSTKTALPFKTAFQAICLATKFQKKKHTLENLNQTFRYIRKGRVLKLGGSQKKTPPPATPSMRVLLGRPFQPTSASDPNRWTDLANPLVSSEDSASTINFLSDGPKKSGEIAALILMGI